MALDQTRSLYLVAKGKYTWTAAEMWQFGIRLVAVHGFAEPTGIVAFPNIDTDEVSDSRTESGWTIDWEWTLTVGGNIFQPDDFLNDQAAPAFLNYFGPVVANTCEVSSLTLYPIKANGKVNGARKAVLQFDGTFPQGIDSSHQLPMEDAVVVSWNTAQVGRRGRGRIYSPPPGVSAIDADGFLTSTASGDLRDAWASLLGALSYSPPSTPNYWVRPVVTGSPWDEGAVIDSVRVGNVVDRQASRRRQLPETYTGNQAVSY